MCCDCEKLEKEKLQLEQENALLREMLRLERQRRFGSSTEQVNPDQPELFEQEKEELEETAVEHIEYDRHKGKKKNLNGRVEIPDSLERREIILDLPEDQKICPVTGEPMIKIGEEITEQLAVEPPKFYVKRYIRPKYASPDRRKGAKVGIRTAALPDSPIDRCKADVSLLANIIVGKYADHIPLYRQEQIFQRYGIKISSSTACDWVNNCAEALTPLYKELRRQILAHDYLQVDETPIDLLRKNQQKRESRLWAVRTGSGPPGVFFHFTESREYKHAKSLLAPFSGSLQTDAYTAYLKVGERKDITLLPCLAHIRRKYMDALKAGDKKTEAFLTLINILYRIEHRIAELPDTVSEVEKLTLRQKRANRVIDRLYRKIDEMNVLPQSLLGKAITYTRNRKTIIRNYLSELRFHPDNNLCEQIVRPVTMGRRNYLFVGSERGGDTAAIFMSFIATCKLNDINPFEYLSDILAKINSHPHKKLAELLPQNWERLRRQK